MSEQAAALEGIPLNWIGLRTSEITLLRRALAVYSAEYAKMKLATGAGWEKEENQRYIEAADRLAERLLKQTVRAVECPEQPQPVEREPSSSEQIAQEIKERAYKLDPECWESYSGRTKGFKQRMETRRRASIEKARRALEDHYNHQH